MLGSKKTPTCLRTNLQKYDPEKLWRQYMQLTEVEAVFRTLKSELNLRPIFHRIQSRVEAHILIAFLACCLWVCLKQKLRSLGGSLTPAQVLHTLKQILMVEVWFDLRSRRPDLPAAHYSTRSAGSTYPPSPRLPEQPPPRIYRYQSRFVGTT